MAPSICYVVPHHSEMDDQHFAHLPRLLAEVAELCDLYVIVERADDPMLIPRARAIIAQRYPRGDRLRRYTELLRIVRRLRRAGCRRFFVRISQGAGLVLAALSRPLDIEVFYWNSGQGRATWPGWSRFGERLLLEARDLPTRAIIRLASRFVTGPESMVAFYMEHYGARPRRTIVLYNDVDLRRYRPADPTEREDIRNLMGVQADVLCLLLVGRVSTYKGGDYIIPIANRLTAAGPATPIEFFVVGEAHLRHLEGPLGSHPSIRYLGPRPSSQVLGYYQMSDVFLLPSRSEGFPRVLLEAMASGLPVVAFDVGGVRDILGPKQQPFVVARDDIDAFVTRVLDLLRDRDLRRELSKENLLTVRRFSTEIVARQFVDRVVLA